MMNVFFDYNGTLLDDVDKNIEIINEMMSERGMNRTLKRDEYQKHFTFPITSFYEYLGFCFVGDEFFKVANEYGEKMILKFSDAELFSDCVDSLLRLKESGARLFVVTACEEKTVKDELLKFGILDLFCAVCGASDFLGKSKVDRAKDLILRLEIDPNDCVFVGDTVHDSDVSREIGIKNIFLVFRGHNDYSTLKKTGRKLFASLKDTTDEILKLTSEA